MDVCTTHIHKHIFDTLIYWKELNALAMHMHICMSTFLIPFMYWKKKITGE